MVSSISSGGQLAGPPTLLGEDCLLLMGASPGLCLVLVDSLLVLLVFVLLQPGKCEFDSLLPSSPLTLVGLSPVEAKDPLLLCFSLRSLGQIPFRPP